MVKELSDNIYEGLLSHNNPEVLRRSLWEMYVHATVSSLLKSSRKVLNPRYLSSLP